MANVRLNHIFKVYDNGVRAVSDFNIDIDDKEFIVFVGPSGCGKSTTLRMIAGLEEITSGELYIGDKLVNDVEPKDRDIAMVFQNYALYPHMTVYQNMAFGLVNQKTPKDEIDRRVKEAARILDLTEYLERKPKEMSGGQMQRVALGRAIVRQSKVFLLDEPLSNLDAKLRASMRTEISRLHNELQTTFIYVTHDQVEAMTMGTRIVVMNKGVVQQIDTPIQLYTHPINKFVAGFIGTPQMNFIDVTLSKDKKDIVIRLDDEISFKKSIDEYRKINSNYLNGDKVVTMGARPDHIVVSDKETNIKCTIELIEQLGNELQLSGSINNDKHTRIILKTDPKLKFNIGDVINIDFKEGELRFFDNESGVSIFNEIPDNNFVDGTIDNESLTIFDQKVSLPPYLQNKYNGEVQVEIPLDAFVEGNDLKLECVGEEKIKDNTLYHFVYKDKYIFGYKSGKTLGVDFSKINIRQNGDLVFSSIKLDTRVKVEFKASKQMGLVKKSSYKNVKDEATGKVSRVEVTSSKEKKLFVFEYLLGDKSYYLTNEESERIINLDGRKALKQKYDLFVPSNAINFEGNDYSFKVDETIDLGIRKFVKINMFGSDMILEHEPADEVSFSLDNTQCSLYEEDSDLKII